MSTIINATTTNGVVIQPDNSGSLVLQTNSGTTALTIDTSQRAAFVAGTAAAPAITTTGDTNTGIFFPAADTIAFAEGGTESMRIDSSGKVGIGMTPTAPLTIQTVNQNFGGGLNLKVASGTSNFEFVNGGDNKLYLGYAASGTPGAVGNFATNGTYTATSDIRKKKDISYIFNGLEIVNALKPAQGRMLEDDDTSPLRPMFIAQDMADVIPALVSNLEPEPSDDPLLGVDYASITPILVKAIQEQQTIINDLKARVETLEAK
jgi:hypothetical protein